ncbi:hypothetical protein [Reyranella sp.]|uniref:hypothetical protein n=1 Tax=Reyranella sp. TaxID=1929291 RepID=UPI003D12A8A9
MSNTFTPSRLQEILVMSDTTQDGSVQPVDPKGLTLLAALAVTDGGSIASDINKAWDELLREMMELDHHEGLRKSKGSLTVKIGLEYEDGTGRLKVELATRTPKAPQRAQVFWLTGDARLTPENPRQMTMFRDVPRRSVNIVG